MLTPEQIQMLARSIMQNRNSAGGPPATPNPSASAPGGWGRRFVPGPGRNPFAPPRVGIPGRNVMPGRGGPIGDWGGPGYPSNPMMPAPGGFPAPTGMPAPQMGQRMAPEMDQMGGMRPGMQAAMEALVPSQGGGIPGGLPRSLPSAGGAAGSAWGSVPTGTPAVGGINPDIAALIARMTGSGG